MIGFGSPGTGATREFDVMVVIAFPYKVALRLGRCARRSETKSVWRYMILPRESFPNSAGYRWPRVLDAHARYWNGSHFTLGREYAMWLFASFTPSREGGGGSRPSA